MEMIALFCKIDNFFLADNYTRFFRFSETDPEAIEDRRFQTLHTQADAHLDEHTPEETKRGILTTRTLRASTLLNEHLNWPGLAGDSLKNCHSFSDGFSGGAGGGSVNVSPRASAVLLRRSQSAISR